MVYAYYNCTKLTGSPICGEKVTNMYYTYAGTNLRGNAYFYSPEVVTVRGCFSNRNNKRRLNIYVLSNSTTNTTVHYTGPSSSLVGASITLEDAGTYQYNTKHNIYIYPVENVAAAAIANGDEEANANAGIV
jgi:hypothetical protein